MDRSQPSNGLTPSERVLQARMAAHISWAKTDDRSARTAPARKAALARFEEQVDPDRRLTPTERARRAEHAQRAHMTRLALRSAQARRRASAHSPGPSDPDTKKPA
jgi:hypothetical protein